MKAIRDVFEERGFLEVETPMMQPIAGGALARPFVTHHNALDMQLYLRIAPELYLKRLTVGGMGRVFEINRNFRNEGISTQHNPEFTMLEFYQAYAEYQGLMALHRGRCSASVARTAIGTTDVHVRRARDLARRAVPAAVAARGGRGEGRRERLGDAGDRRRCCAIAPRRRGVAARLGHRRRSPATAPARSRPTIFETLWEDSLIQPTFVYDFPTEVSPLSKQKPDDPDTVERFELYVGGFELANGFSELNDPDEQRRRFEAQLAQRDGGDQEAHAMDEDYVRALDVRPAADRRRRHRHRSPGDAADRQPVDPRRHPVPADATAVDCAEATGYGLQTAGRVRRSARAGQSPTQARSRQPVV